MRTRVVWLLMVIAVASVASESHDRELLASSAGSSSSAASHAGDAGGGPENLLPVTPPVTPPVAPPATLPVTPPETPPVSSSPPVPAPAPAPAPAPMPLPPQPITPSPTAPPGFLPDPPTTAPPSTTTPPTTSRPKPPRPIPGPLPDPPPDPPESPSPPPHPQPAPSPNPTTPGAGATPAPAPAPPAAESPSPPPVRPSVSPPQTPPPPPPTRAPTPNEETESPSPPPRRPSPPTPANPPTNPSGQPTLPSPATPAPPNSGNGGGGGPSGETRESPTPSLTTQPDPASSPSSPSSPSTAEMTPTPTPKRYQRGDDVIIINKVENGTNVSVEVVVSPSKSPAVVVRDTGKATGSQSADVGAATAAGSDTGDSVYKFLQYLTSSLAFASLLLLIVFHFVASQPSRQISGGDSDSVTASMSTPNQWELLAFITYIQAMASSALYIVRSAPAFYWRYLDAFSWTMFLPFHFSSSGISYTTSSTGSQRRLTAVVVLDGLVAFADRIGVNEEDLLQTSVAGFLVVCGVLLVVTMVVVYVVRVHKDDEFDSETPVEQLGADCSQVHSVEVDFHEKKKKETPFSLLVVSGLVVIFAAFALYPLVLITTFEISSQIRAGQVSSGSLTIAIVTLFFVCAAFVARSLDSVSASRDTEDSYRNGTKFRMVWGSMCSSDCINYDRRVIFVAVWLVMQVSSALIVSCVQSEKLQLGLLIGISVSFVVSLIIFRPFTYSAKVAIVVICSIAVIKAVNTALVFAFLSSTSSSTNTRRAVATTFIVLNSVLIVLWFVRLFGLACRLARSAWDERAQSRKNTAATSAAARSNTPDSTRNQSTQYVAIVPTHTDGRSVA